MFFNMFPYTDFHELNLDWILREIKRLRIDVDEFTALNEIINGGAWSITESYRAWTIVSNNNKGYISLKPVPAGVQISDTEYWAQIINYAPDLKQRKVIFISDSYGVGWNPDEGDTRGYINRMVEYLGLVEGRTAFINAKSGYGFNNANGYFIDLLNEVTTPDPEEITDIFVGGGVNDAFSDPNDLDAAIEAFMARAKEVYPNATVSVAMIGGSRNVSIKGGLIFSTEHYKKASMYENGRYLDNSEFILVDKRLISSDNTHPLDAGYADLAYYLSNGMKGGGIDVVHPREQLDTSNVHSLQLYWAQNNDKVFLELNVNRDDLPYNAVYSNQWQSTLSLTGRPFNGYGDTIASTGCVVKHTVGGNDQYDFYPMYLRLTDTLMEYYVNTGATMTIQNVTLLSGRYGVITLPANRF